MVNTHRCKTLSMQNPASHPQLSSSDTRGRKQVPDKAALPGRTVSANEGWSRQAWRGQGWLVIFSYRSAVPCIFSDSPTKQDQQLGYSQSCQRHDQHTDCNFTPRIFSFSLIPAFPNKGELFSIYLLFLQKMVCPSRCLCFVHSTEPQGTLALCLQHKTMTHITATCSHELVIQGLADMVS